VRFLVDQNRSPRLSNRLRDAGHDAVHTSELGLERAADEQLLLLAAEQDRIVVSGDTDFGALLALLTRRSPSVILFRSRTLVDADSQAELLLAYLDDLAGDLEAGCVAVISDSRIRVRRLPLLHDT
jgi:predicted nuclease of predicted toxin-antitoxin system